VRLVKHCLSVAISKASPRLTDDLPTSLAGEPVRASINRPRIISKNEQAEEASIKGDDRLLICYHLEERKAINHHALDDG
jgi:hypothetical protein